MELSEINDTYQAVLNDIFNGRNLLQHLRDIEAEISGLDSLIEEGNQAGTRIVGFEKLKKEYSHLKDLISERL